MVRKGKSAIEGDPKKGWNWTEMEARAEQEEAGLEASPAGTHRQEETPHPPGPRGRHQHPDQRSNQNRPPAWPHRTGDRGGGGPNGQTARAKRASVGRKQRSRKITDEKREKLRAKNKSPQNTPTRPKGTSLRL